MEIEMLCGKLVDCPCDNEQINTYSVVSEVASQLVSGLGHLMVDTEEPQHTIGVHIGSCESCKEKLQEYEL